MKLSTIVFLCSALMIVGCSSTQSLTGTRWEIRTIGKRTLQPVAEKGYPTLLLESESNRASGFGGCNRYSGGYTLKENTLRFGPMATTKMACEDSQTEDELMLALASIQMFKISNTTLILQGADGKGILECVPETQK